MEVELSEGSMRPILLLLALQQAPEFTYDEWQAWDSFEVGAVVEHSYSNNYDATSFTCLDRIEKKEAGTVTLKRTIGKSEMTVTIRKDDPNRALKGACRSCGKKHKEEAKLSKTRMKVGDREVEGVLSDATHYDCDGKTVTVLVKTWYSKAVPGWKVNEETVDAQERKQARTCLRFETKN